MKKVSLLSLAIRNFYSVGNVTQTVTFDNGKMNLVLGENIDYGEGIRNGVGKSQPHDCKVKIPNGWTSIGDIKVGQKVCTPDGGIAIVTGKYPQGITDVCRVTVKGGSNTKASPDHLWEVLVDGITSVKTTREIQELIKTTSVYIPETTYTLETSTPYNYTRLLGLYTTLSKGIERPEIVEEFTELTQQVLNNSYEVREEVAERLSIDAVSPSRPITAVFMRELLESVGHRVSYESYSFHSTFNSSSTDRINLEYQKSDIRGYTEVTSVIDLNPEETTCIKISSERQLYITDNYIVTHNTTIINGISYALFGKPVTKSKQDSMVNYLNKKNMVVRIDFKVDDELYFIERGRKPAILRFVKVSDGEEEDMIKSLGENHDTDKAIEQLIGMSYLLAKHVMLMSTYTTPFMASSASEQRQIIEELILITELSEKAALISDKEKILKSEIEKEKVRLKGLADSNDKTQRTINAMFQNESQWEQDHKDAIEKFQTQLDNLMQINIEEELKAHEHNQAQQLISNDLKLLMTEKSNAEANCNRSMNEAIKVNEKLDEAEHTTNCPTCKQDIVPADLEDYKKSLMESALGYLSDSDNASAMINEINAMIDEVKSKQEPLKQTVYRTLGEAQDHNSKIKICKDRLENELQAENPYTKQMTEMDSLELEAIDYTHLDQMEKELDHYKLLKKLLSDRDSFIRKDIIKKNIPTLNKQLQYHLPKLSLPHVITFEPSLTFNIKFMGIEMDYNNLSRGEQNRLTFALNLAFRDVFEENVGTNNCIFVDELLDFGIDTKGARDGLYMLKNYSKTQNKSTFLVTHKDELVENADTIIYVRKEDDFTSYEKEESED